MKVDRARFLLLTTALSAATAVAVTAGCTIKSSDNGSSGTTTTPPSEAGSPYDSSTDAYYADSDTDDGGACLDDTGADPNCDAATESSCNMACQHYLLNYKKGVARSIAKCIAAIGTCTGKDNEIAACVQTALGAACTDPTAEGFCGPLADACDSDAGTDAGAAAPLGKQECVDLVTGLNTMGRGQFKGCVTDNMTTAGYCAANPSACIDQIE